MRIHAGVGHTEESAQRFDPGGKKLTIFYCAPDKGSNLWSLDLESDAPPKTDTGRRRVDQEGNKTEARKEAIIPARMLAAIEEKKRLTNAQRDFLTTSTNEDGSGQGGARDGFMPFHQGTFLGLQNGRPRRDRRAMPGTEVISGHAEVRRTRCSNNKTTEGPL